jgi:hypothetical protein
MAAVKETQPGTTTSAANQGSGTAPIGGAGGFAHPLGLIGFLTAVVGLEFGAVWFLLSRHSPGDVALAPEITPAVGKSLAPPEVIGTTIAPDGAEPTSGGVEVDLGEFTVSFHRLSTGTTLRLDFHLYGIVDQRLEEKFKEIWPKHVNRFRETVITTVRGAQPAELADPTLALIKRQILEKSNRLFGGEFLQGLVVSDFSLVEQ